jgi:hypothetical protein
MEYIDKRNGEVPHQLLDEFLRVTKKSDGTYPDDLYDTLGNTLHTQSSHTYRQDLTQYILAENNDRCCYCMRQLKPNKVSNRYPVTLEHVITRECVSAQDYKKYFQMPSDLAKEDRMIWANQFRSRHNPPFPPYPHTVAYENLIPSCEGRLANRSIECCNLKRGNHFLQPLNFRPAIHEEVVYHTDGSMEWTEDPELIIPTVVILGLDCLTLRAIRSIWYYLASHQLALETADRSEVLYSIILETEDHELTEMLMNFEKDTYWNLLADYSYFNDVNVFD